MYAKLRQKLQGLREKLKTGHGYSSGARNTSDIRDDAIGHLGDIYPLELFLAWLDRCPEARDELDGADPAIEASDRKLVSSTPAGGALSFRANLGRGYVDVGLIEVVGRLLKVRLSGSLAIHAITIDSVSPVDRDRVARAIALMPGSEVELTFDPLDEEPPTEEAKREFDTSKDVPQWVIDAQAKQDELRKRDHEAGSDKMSGL